MTCKSANRRHFIPFLKKMDDTLNSSFLSVMSMVSNLGLPSSSDDDSSDENFDDSFILYDPVFFRDQCPEKSKRNFKFHDRRIFEASLKMSDSLFRSHFRVSKGKCKWVLFLGKVSYSSLVSSHVRAPDGWDQGILRRSWVHEWEILDSRRKGLAVPFLLGR